MVRQLAFPETRWRLLDLLGQNLAFHNGNKGYRIHALHAFAARFPPELPRHFIAGLTTPGDTVLDPMAGSGATLVEGWLLSRNVIGVDLDPLAVRQSRAKTSWIEPAVLERAGDRVLNSAWLSTRTGQPLTLFIQRTDEVTKKFIINWFKPETQRELAALVLAINEEQDWPSRRFLELLFSSVIVTKSGGVSMARDLAHSRPHKVEDKVPRSALAVFDMQLRRAIRALEEIRDSPKGQATVVAGDCRRLPIPSESVDLIVTSPPYANALDYVRAHKFSLAWLGESIGKLGKLRGHYIGAERLRQTSGTSLTQSVSTMVSELARRDIRKAQVLDAYFRDMAMAVAEMVRVLRRGRAAVVVVGPSTMRELRIDTHQCIASLAEQAGFDVIGIAQRPLDRDRRMMPARATNNGGSMIEQRIHEEFVIGLVKP